MRSRRNESLFLFDPWVRCDRNTEHATVILICTLIVKDIPGLSTTSIPRNPMGFEKIFNICDVIGTVYCCFLVLLSHYTLRAPTLHPSDWKRNAHASGDSQPVLTPYRVIFTSPPRQISRMTLSPLIWFLERYPCTVIMSPGWMNIRVALILLLF